MHIINPLLTSDVYRHVIHMSYLRAAERKPNTAMNPYTAQAVFLPEPTITTTAFFSANKNGRFRDYLHGSDTSIDLPNWRCEQHNANCCTLYSARAGKQERPRLVVRRRVSFKGPKDVSEANEPDTMIKGQFYDLDEGLITTDKYYKYKSQDTISREADLDVPCCGLVCKFAVMKVAREMSLNCHIEDHCEAATAGLAHQYNMSLLNFVEAEETRQAEERARERILTALTSLLTAYDKTSSERTYTYETHASGKKYKHSADGHFSPYVLLQRKQVAKLGHYFARAPSRALFIQPLVVPGDIEKVADVKREQTAGIGKLTKELIANQAHDKFESSSDAKTNIEATWTSTLGEIPPAFYEACLGTIDGGFNGRKMDKRVSSFNPERDNEDPESIKDKLKEILDATESRGPVSAVSSTPYNYIRGSNVVRRTTHSLSLNDWMGHETFKAYAERLRTRLKRGRPDDDSDSFAVLPEDRGALHGMQIRAVSCSMGHRLHNISEFCSHVILSLLHPTGKSGMTSLSAVFFETESE